MGLRPLRSLRLGVLGLGFGIWGSESGLHTARSDHMAFPLARRPDEATRSNRKSTLPPHNTKSPNSGGVGDAASRWCVAQRATGERTAAGGRRPVGRSPLKPILLPLSVCFREEALERLEAPVVHAAGARFVLLFAERNVHEDTEVGLERWRGCRSCLGRGVASQRLLTEDRHAGRC